MSLPEYNDTKLEDGVKIFEYESVSAAEEVKTTFERIVRELGMEEELPLFYQSDEQIRVNRDYADELLEIKLDKNILTNRDLIVEKVKEYA